jgi:hypothetical protein
MSLEGNYQNSEDAVAIAIDYPYVYVAYGEWGVSVLSLSEGFLTPVPVGFYDTTGEVLDVAALDSYFYLADGSNGFAVAQYYGPTSIESPVDTGGPLPHEFDLSQNFPNPFNPHTSITFEVDCCNANTDQHITLVIDDVRGRRINTLANGEYPPGRYEVSWDGRDSGGRSVPSGIYLYSLKTESRTRTRKMILAR